VTGTPLQSARRRPISRRSILCGARRFAHPQTVVADRG
jgi:hypothetical protein